MKCSGCRMGGVWLARLLVVSLVVCSSIAKSPPPRKKVIVEGSVSCLYCVMEGGPGSVQKTALLPGAVMKLQCNNTKKGSWEVETKSDNKGEFVFMPEKVSSWGAHKCEVLLVSSPRPDCPDIISSSLLIPAPTNASSPFQRYTLRPLSFYPGPFMCV